MNLYQFLLLLRARRRLILSTLLVTVLLALGWSLIQNKTYTATASVLLNYKGVDPLTGVTTPGQLLPGYMATQIDIITSKNVALRVVDRLRLATSPVVIAQFQDATDGKGSVRDWLADLLLRKLEIKPARESSVVEISFKGADPAFAAAVANAFAEEYQNASVQLKTEPMKKAASYFNEQTKQLRDNVETAQARLSKYQQEKGIVSLDNNRVDIELARLNDLSSQLVAAQAAALEATSRERMAGGNAVHSPDVANNPLVQNLRVALASAEAKLAEGAARYGSNHPQYRAARAEVDKMRADLNAALGTVSKSVGGNAQVLRQREEELRAALAAQKTRVLELNRTRDELGVLLKDLDSAQRAFDAASGRFSQTRIEAQAEQSDIAVLNPAVAPAEPSGPRVLLNTLVAILLGSILGVGLALLLELLQRPVRSGADVHDLLGIPVLGTIEWQAPRPRSGLRALMAPRRLLRLN
ncbi:chain length determinant protein EpsF [Massilia sp. Dwa41.01b]|uniref:chain length determinant protein EpsF n=1 Tax=unclassified Massilia TaxID=2609279 RepID=UPI001602C78C|nr:MULTISPECIES: chain length determinant protein EpsF [unclassified Massilia]QNA88427.1 chain length determinant protein EpsF [Massilia sp. Dwa41.01b]QNA99322.1 chain length determinant protein EpsF [Massilia sp. Se16.2.3]